MTVVVVVVERDRGGSGGGGGLGVSSFVPYLGLMSAVIIVGARLMISLTAIVSDRRASGVGVRP